MRTLTVELKSGISAGGFKVIIKDGDIELCKEDYSYGYNVSWSDKWADEKKPYVSDLLTGLVKAYQIDKIVITRGMNVFARKPVDDTKVMDFKTKYIDGHEELEKLC